MRKLWNEKTLKNPMEETIIEVFGCTTLKDTVIKLFTGKDKISSDFYVNGNRQDLALIEIFGCIPFDNVIEFGTEKEKGVEVYRRYEPVEALVVGIN